MAATVLEPKKKEGEALEAHTGRETALTHQRPHYSIDP